jgi:Flp pilus assembly protein TadG
MFKVLNSKKRLVRRGLPRRRAGVVLELILVLPILVITLFAVVEFGLVMANLKQVALASREGARMAADAAPLDAATTSLIRAAIDRRLESAGLGASATQGITVQETVTFNGPFTDGICPVITSPAMPGNAVRVTVCVELDRLTPNLLQAFGFDISGRVVEHTSTFRYEL